MFKKKFAIFDASFKTAAANDRFFSNTCFISHLNTHIFHVKKNQSKIFKNKKVIRGQTFF